MSDESAALRAEVAKLRLDVQALIRFVRAEAAEAEARRTIRARQAEEFRVATAERRSRWADFWPNGSAPPPAVSAAYLPLPNGAVLPVRSPT